MRTKVAFYFLLGLICFSCEKDSASKYAENIVGNWKLTSGEPISNFEPCDYKGFKTFKSGNTLIEIDDCIGTTSNGLWRISDNILTVSNDEFPMPVDMLIVTLSDSKMTLKFMGDVENYLKVPDSQRYKCTPQIAYTAKMLLENGVIINTGTETKYCGTAATQQQARPNITVGNLTTKIECRK